VASLAAVTTKGKTMTKAQAKLAKMCEDLIAAGWSLPAVQALVDDKGLVVLTTGDVEVIE
jgi:hypothetical protein